MISSGARRAAWLAAFAAAMGILEAIVVVYLRELYYPGGFRFPIVRMPDRIAVFEIFREAATIVMLLAVAALARRDRTDGFFVFAWLFGVWDLVYYAGLRLFLGWPESLGTWDLLFLIPVPWVSPVIYPVMVSLLLLAGFAANEMAASKGRSAAPARVGWLVSVAGALGIVISFCWRYRDVLDGHVPGDFPAALFWTALAIAASPFVVATCAALRQDPRGASGKR
jgi:hypothetical protein